MQHSSLMSDSPRLSEFNSSVALPRTKQFDDCQIVERLSGHTTCRQHDSGPEPIPCADIPSSVQLLPGVLPPTVSDDETREMTSQDKLCKLPEVVLQIGMTLPPMAKRPLELCPFRHPGYLAMELRSLPTPRHPSPRNEPRTRDFWLQSLY